MGVHSALTGTLTAHQILVFGAKKSLLELLRAHWGSKRLIRGLKLKRAHIKIVFKEAHPHHFLLWFCFELLETKNVKILGLRELIRTIKGSLRVIKALCMLILSVALVYDLWVATKPRLLWEDVPLNVIMRRTLDSEQRSVSK